MIKCSMQRILDIILSSLAIVFFTPLFILVIFILKFTGEGQILYKQPRVGKDGKIFNIWKFATMLKNSSKMKNGDITIVNDPRVLPVGKFLRFTKVNELPQLVNILIGDMSIVGPRPLTPNTFKYYPVELHAELLKVRPGLSGIGSIIFRDEESLLVSNNDANDYYQKVISPYKGKLEIWYIQNKNIKNYFLIIILTIYALFFSNKKVLWKLFKTLPLPPDNFKLFIRYQV